MNVAVIHCKGKKKVREFLIASPAFASPTQTERRIKILSLDSYLFVCVGDSLSEPVVNDDLLLPPGARPLFHRLARGAVPQRQTADRYRIFPLATSLCIYFACSAAQVVRQRFIAAQIGYQEIKLKQPPTPQMIKLDKIYMYTIPVFDKKGSCGTSRCSAASRSLSQRVHLLEWQSPSSPFAEAASRSFRPNLWHVFWKTLPLFFFHNRQHNKRMCTSAKRSYLLKQLKNKKKKKKLTFAAREAGN
jgi:hypothetical protein